jgi:heptosyltransferase-2
MQKRTVAEVQRLAQDQPLTKRAPFTHAGHHIYHYLRLAAALGANPEPLAPVIEVREEEVSALRERFSLPRDRPDRPLFGLNPGAEYGAAKRWPEDRFIVAAREIQERTRCRWVLIGGKADVELNEKIEAAIRDDGGDAAGSAGDRQAVWNLTGATSLRELCAAMKACRLLLTNDTGPMHVASAVGTPLVALFGSTTPMLTGPGLPGDPRHRLISAPVSCSPCFLRECPIDFRCMRSISVEQVVESVLNACGPIQ